jgi:hypothetical protein
MFTVLAVLLMVEAVVNCFCFFLVMKYIRDLQEKVRKLAKKRGEDV